MWGIGLAVAARPCSTTFSFPGLGSGPYSGQEGSKKLTVSPRERCRRVGLAASITGYPPSPLVLWNQRFRRKFPQNLWLQRTCRKNIADKRLSPECLAPPGTRPASQLYLIKRRRGRNQVTHICDVWQGILARACKLWPETSGPPDRRGRLSLLVRLDGAVSWPNNAPPRR